MNEHCDLCEQEDFLDTLIVAIRSMRESARSEELFENINSIIEVVTEKMKELKEE